MLINEFEFHTYLKAYERMFFTTPFEIKTPMQGLKYTMVKDNTLILCFDLDKDTENAVQYAKEQGATVREY